MKALLLSAGLALWSAAAMTFGDWLWAALSLQHRAPYGLAHGTLLCLWMGLYLGAIGQRVAMGMIGGAAIGLLAAGSFYAIAPLVGYSAMFASWMLLWFGLVALAERAITGRIHAASWAARGVVAAIGSVVAFYAVSGIWMSPPRPPNYVWNFAAWTIAFLPGSIAMLWRKR